jgi:hypothetical protein
MHGLSLLEKIREVQPDTRLVVVTGVRDEHLVVSAMKAGAADFLCKDDLLTSGIIRSLQALLRARDAEKYERRTPAENGHQVEEAMTGVEWLLESFAADSTFSGQAATPPADDELWTTALEALLRYMEDSFRAYPDTATVTEGQVIRMLMARGSAPAEVLLLYGAALRSMLAAEVTPPMDPNVCLLRIMARLLAQYQTKVSLETVAPHEEPELDEPEQAA